MRKVLLVIDMQKDFIDGVLGTEEAINILPKVKEKIERALECKKEVYFTLDTHGKDYLNTAEGKKLPVPHCIEGTKGWELHESIKEAIEGYSDKVDYRYIKKNTFGSLELQKYIYDQGKGLQIEMIGVCTDICVVTNALILKTQMPDAEIIVDASCCAGVTKEKHDAALEVMRSCQIEVINAGECRTN